MEVLVCNVSRDFEELSPSSLEDFLQKASQKFNLGGKVRLVWEEDGTEIQDDEYFQSLVEDKIKVMILESQQKWKPKDAKTSKHWRLTNLVGWSKTELKEELTRLKRDSESETEKETSSSPDDTAEIRRRLREGAVEQLLEARNARRLLRELLKLPQRQEADEIKGSSQPLREGQLASGFTEEVNSLPSSFSELADETEASQPITTRSLPWSFTEDVSHTLHSEGTSKNTGSSPLQRRLSEQKIVDSSTEELQDYLHSAKKMPEHKGLSDATLEDRDVIQEELKQRDQTIEILASLPLHLWKSQEDYSKDVVTDASPCVSTKFSSNDPQPLDRLLDVIKDEPQLITGLNSKDREMLFAASREKVSVLGNFGVELQWHCNTALVAEGDYEDSKLLLEMHHQNGAIPFKVFA